MVDQVTSVGAPMAREPAAQKAALRASQAPSAAQPETERPVRPVSDSKALKELEEEINGLIERLLASNLRLRIETDSASRAYVYKGVDRDTGEVKKQWPPEKILQLRAFFRALEGLLVDETA